MRFIQIKIQKDSVKEQENGCNEEASCRQRIIRYKLLGQQEKEKHTAENSGNFFLCIIPDMQEGFKTYGKKQEDIEEGLPCRQ